MINLITCCNNIFFDKAIRCFKNSFEKNEDIKRNLGRFVAMGPVAFVKNIESNLICNYIYNPKLDDITSNDSS